jgi:hypothetical protein
MRTLVTIAFAVVAGVHCSAPTSSGDATTATDEPAATQTEEPASPAPAPSTGGDPSAPAQSDDGDWRWSIDAEGLPPTVFTSTVRGDDGALYAAGTYAGSLTLGRGTVTSKGADDVVLARLDNDGHIAWVKSIG